MSTNKEGTVFNGLDNGKNPLLVFSDNLDLLESLLDYDSGFLESIAFTILELCTLDPSHASPVVA